ncbi:MAG: hypothetical protein V1897_03915 [Pseudomonadota bacterium]
MVFVEADICGARRDTSRQPEGFTSKPKFTALGMSVFEDEVFSSQTCDIASDVVVASKKVVVSIEAHIRDARLSPIRSQRFSPHRPNARHTIVISRSPGTPARFGYVFFLSVP